MKLKDDLRVNLPSVPSTQHLTPNGEIMLIFFALRALLMTDRYQCGLAVFPA